MKPAWFLVVLVLLAPSALAQYGGGTADNTTDNGTGQTGATGAGGGGGLGIVALGLFLVVVVIVAVLALALMPPR